MVGIFLFVLDFSYVHLNKNEKAHWQRYLIVNHQGKEWGVRVEAWKRGRQENTGACGLNGH